MMKYSESFRNSGAYTSPGTPEYGCSNLGDVPRGWCSERVALPASSAGRRQVSTAAFMPFNSGRVLPSKWDDAERWITSPVSSYNTLRTPITQPQRQPESKSGPLGSPRFVDVTNYSPVMGDGNMNEYMGNVPLAAGVLVPNALSVLYDGSGSPEYKSFCSENNISRSTSVPVLSDFLTEPSGHNSQDDRHESAEEEGAVERRDIATQTCTEGVTRSSPKEILSPSNVAHRDEVRDVEVDKGIGTGRQLKKPALGKVKDSRNGANLPSTWSAVEGAKKIRFQREEAKIIAWENLQKAKSEAAIRKLEMKLEKKRSASMDKILKKLETAEVKAQVMRHTLSENQAHQTFRTHRFRDSMSIIMRIRSFGHFGHCFASRRD